jgi:hypothetical protein
MNRWRRAMDLAWEAFEHPAYSQDDSNVGVPGVPIKNNNNKNNELIEISARTPHGIQGVRGDPAEDRFPALCSTAIAAPTPEEIAADWSQAFGVPVEWAEGYQAMAGNNPGSIPARRWSGLMVAVAVIFERWARQAIALGWDELDLIGAHPRYPVQRIDHQGLCWFIGHDTELLALTDPAARFRKPSGAVQSVSRKPIKEPGDARIWDLCKSRSE